MTSAPNLHSTASPTTKSPAAGKRPKGAARLRPPKGNSHTDLSRDELQKMLFQAARSRALNARSR